MNRIISFFKESNRWKHLLGGLFVGVMGFSVYGALFSSAVAATCLELKDRMYGNKFDITDWLCTFAGGVFAALFYQFVL